MLEVHWSQLDVGCEAGRDVMETWPLAKVEVGRDLLVVGLVLGDG